SMLAEVPRTEIGTVVVLASNRRSIVAAQHFQNSDDTRIWIFQRDGTLAMSGTVPQRVVEILSDGTEYFLFFQQHVSVMNESGTIVQTIPFSEYRVAAATFNGRDFLVSAIRNETRVLLHVSRFGILSEEPFPGVGRLASDGRTAVVGWKEAHAGPYPPSPYSVSLHAASTTSAGALIRRQLDAPIDEFIGRFAGWFDPPAVATNGEIYLMVWTEGTSANGLPTRAVYSLLLQADSTISAEELARRRRHVATTYAPQEYPDLARNGKNAFVVWAEPFREETGEIGRAVFATRVTPSGAIVDGSGLLIARDLVGLSAVAAWNGTETVIVWPAGDLGIKAAFVAPDGSVSPPVVISSHRGAPRIACGDGICLVVWAAQMSGTPMELYAARLMGRTVLDPEGILIARGQGLHGSSHDVAAHGTDFLVAWSELFYPGGAIVHSIFVRNALEGIATREQDIAATTNSYGATRVVWSGGQYLVFFNEASPHNATARVMRVSEEGFAMDGEATSWQGIDFASGGISRVSATEGEVYANIGADIVRIDPLTLEITGHVNGTGTVFDLAGGATFVLTQRDDRLFYRRLGRFRTRLVER
ncbi:MAG TPA: hypothetical protein VF057_00635, partial [Thermoanaerobaculia bacterium]